MTRLILILSLLLPGCASLQSTFESTDTFAACRALDISTTAIGLHTGKFAEANGLVKAMLAHGYIPWIALSVAVWYALDKLNNPTATTVLNAVTCPIGIRNAVLLVK